MSKKCQTDGCIVRTTGMFHWLKKFASRANWRLRCYRDVAAHPRTPLLAKGCLLAAVGYAAMPFDLIPDFIPVVGHLDDVVIVPTLIALALWLVPADVYGDCHNSLRAR